MEDHHSYEAATRRHLPTIAGWVLVTKHGAFDGYALFSYGKRIALIRRSPRTHRQVEYVMWQGTAEPRSRGSLTAAVGAAMTEYLNSLPGPPAHEASSSRVASAIVQDCLRRDEAAEEEPHDDWSVKR